MTRSTGIKKSDAQRRTLVLLPDGRTAHLFAVQPSRYVVRIAGSGAFLTFKKGEIRRLGSRSGTRNQGSQ